jgi:stage III sporulation protein AG
MKLESSIIKKLKNMKKDQLIIFVLIGVLLIVISIPTEKKSKEANEENQEKEVQIPTENIEDTMGYEEKMEKRLSETLAMVEGVGKVKVMVTLQNSSESVVEKDVPNTRNTTSEADSAGGTRTSMDVEMTESTIYTTDSEGHQSPYVTKEIEPIVKGVVVVAEGGNNPVVVNAITESTEALFQIESHKIKVMKMKNQK